jgi:hypothetical protein
MTYFEESPDGPWLVTVALPEDAALFERDENRQAVLSVEVRTWIEENYPDVFVHEVGAAATLIFYDRGAQTHFRLRF